MTRALESGATVRYQYVRSPDSCAGVVEWQTRRTQNPVGATLCGFKSRLRHHEIQRLTRYAYNTPLFLVPELCPCFTQTHQADRVEIDSSGLCFELLRRHMLEMMLGRSGGGVDNGAKRCRLGAHRCGVSSGDTWRYFALSQVRHCQTEYRFARSPALRLDIP